jgi:hypothetical protein
MGSNRERSPWVSALLNFFIWGGGYIYNGKRKAFGAGLILARAL